MLSKMQTMTDFGMRLIAAVQMELLVHKAHQVRAADSTAGM
jgi:hypothetical protein